MEMLSVQNLNKSYEKFHLKDVSFTLEKGYIMGFIGRNGAGKTTTLKTILNLAHPSSGKVMILGQEYLSNEFALKQQIGVMFGDISFYPKQRLSTITSVVKRFYDEWDDTAYQTYLKRFDLDESKKMEELSRGMRIKYELALALSHKARLLILDEPTSGLDPVSRDDLLELFAEIIQTGERSILFSTHITSDLEKCADYITYIENGRIIESRAKDELLDAYRLVKGTSGQLAAVMQRLVAWKTHAFGFTGLMRTADLHPSDALSSEAPNLEDIMIYHARKETNHEELAL
jgi:ABC-2 type transport system ATP-binding protein